MARIRRLQEVPPPPARRLPGRFRIFQFLCVLAVLATPLSFAAAQVQPGSPTPANAGSAWEAQEAAFVAEVIDTGLKMQLDPRFSKVIRQCFLKGISQKQLYPRCGFTETGNELTCANSPQGQAKKSGIGVSTDGCSSPSQYMRRI